MIGKTLGHYQITSQLGKGGMGEVYQAKDQKLGRDVAIKVLPDEFAKDSDRVARFQREAKVLASLNHANIAAIHSLEESGGTNFLVLELVGGDTLADRLMRGAIPGAESLKLALQIAEALEAAHEKGIIHRDLKPGNIMVTREGSVKLLDFGLAKLYEQNASSSGLPTADFPATQAGAILGTVAYMSPEQAQGKAADARSDIFSFGLVLYEMLSGRRAFSGDTPLAIGSALIKEEPPQLQTSPSIDKIVHRCLAKHPSKRYQTMAEVRAALGQVSREMESKSFAERQPSIAVLPFVNMSGDKEQEYFSDGLAEEIINALAQIPGLKVTARTSAFAFKGKQEDIRRIAELLGVTNILEGSVRKAGNRIRVTAQLISAADGNHLWSERYDREMTDVFAIQDEISQTISAKLSVRLAGDRPLVKRHTDNLEAFNLYLKGQYYMSKLSPEAIAQRVECFEQAIAMDPSYAKPWAGLAAHYIFLALGGIMPAKAAYAQSSQAAHKALALDEMLPEAHAIMAVLRAVDFDWADAGREFRRALQLGPEVSDVWYAYYGCYLMPMRRLEDGIAAARRALDLDPLSPIRHTTLGSAYFVNGQYDQAIAQVRAALELDPNYHLARATLSYCFLKAGKFDEAVNEIDTAAKFLGFMPIIAAARGYVYARVGRIDEAKKALDQLSKLALQTNVPALALAIIYVGLGEIETCFDWLDKAVEERDTALFTIPASPIYDSLRSHPRYQALLRKMNLVDVIPLLIPRINRD